MSPTAVAVTARRSGFYDWGAKMGIFHDLMDRELRIRGFAENTRKSYLLAMRCYVRHFMRPPDQLTSEEVKQYQLHLTKERRVGGCTSLDPLFFRICADCLPHQPPQRAPLPSSSWRVGYWTVILVTGETGPMVPPVKSKQTASRVMGGRGNGPQEWTALAAMKCKPGVPTGSSTWLIRNWTAAGVVAHSPR
jgi:hypothetical protein